MSPSKQITQISLQDKYSKKYKNSERAIVTQNEPHISDERPTTATRLGVKLNL